ncbi:GNAT family N-acetyltransferase [Catenulispora pinisilvae]|uniref:GNAT family N-acetyltransferase n=1 Tax=Catenulispora pinisilvae TaxID=2705253 RepID=UPI00189283E5|nr:GNAT family N-acetyltransferase [Catenulispora pinisilvae]
MVQKSLAAELQERAARAVPAEFGERVGQWWLRHAPGCSWWIGSVLPHGGHEASRAELEALIAAAEAYTAEREIPTLLQMTPEAVPPRLDALLAARGYERQVPVSLQTATTAEVLALAQRGSERGSLRVRLDKHPTREWFQAWSAVVGGDPEPRWRLLQRITEAGAYASVELGDETVAVGRAVAEGGWAGIFNMATRPEARGKGAAGAVIAALADWAAVNDAARMYLQVEQENEGALRLYARAGFTELSPFYFRVKE